MSFTPGSKTAFQTSATWSGGRVILRGVAMCHQKGNQESEQRSGREGCGKRPQGATSQKRRDGRQRFQDCDGRGFRKRLGNDGLLFRCRELRDIAAARNAETELVGFALVGIVGVEEFAEAMRLHAHDIVEPTVEIRFASEDFDCDNGFLDLFSAAFGGFDDEVFEEVPERGGFPESLGMEHPVEVYAGLRCASRFSGFDGDHGAPATISVYNKGFLGQARAQDTENFTLRFARAFLTAKAPNAT